MSRVARAKLIADRSVGNSGSNPRGGLGGIWTRPATIHDLDLVVELIVALLSELSEGDECDPVAIRATTESALAIPGHAIFLAGTANDRGDGVITLEPGFAIYAGGRIGTIRELYTRPSVRSKGLGAALIEAALRHAAGQGWCRIEVTLPNDPPGSPTERFYVREGFGASGPKLKRII